MKKRYLYIIITLVLGIQYRTARSQSTPYDKKLEDFGTFVAGEMKKNTIPGLTIGFIKDDIIWVKGFGYADLEKGKLADAASVYRLASVQKSMTATAILQLVEQKKIKLDNKIQDYVPYFPQKEYTITVRQLLGHLGGIPHYLNPPVEIHFKEHKTTREAIAVFENRDLVAMPGSKYHYSSYGYNLLGAAIENVSGQSYEAYMREHVWGPAGMNHTRMEDPAEKDSNNVTGYRLINGAIKKSVFIDISSRFAAGGTRGTVTDLLNFMKALNDGKLLSGSGRRLMYTSMLTDNGTRTGYGMGWVVAPQRSGLVILHTGGQPETKTFILNFPEKHFALAFAQNIEGPIDFDIITRLYELVLDERLVVKNMVE